MGFLYGKKNLNPMFTL